MSGNFYTVRGYDRKDGGELSPSMEDYLEMIFRSERTQGYVRMNQLAAMLHVTPPAASKMVGKLKEHGMVEFEPYGIIMLTEHGQHKGEFLLHRHEVLHRLFCLINGTESELELVERIEHYFDERTVVKIEAILLKLDGLIK